MARCGHTGLSSVGQGTFIPRSLPHTAILRYSEGNNPVYNPVHRTTLPNSKWSFTGSFPRLPSESLLLSCLQWQQLNQLTNNVLPLPLHFYPPLSLLSIFGWEPLIPMTLPLCSTPRPEAERQQIVNETGLVLALDFYQKGHKQNLNKHCFSLVYLPNGLHCWEQNLLVG